jgi:hypothetical protein
MQRVFRLDQDRINSLSYEQQVALFECGDHRGVDWRACDGVVRDDDRDGGDEDDSVTMLMVLKIVEFGVPYSYTLHELQFKIAEFIGAIRGAMERGVNEGGVVTEEMVRQRCLFGNYIGCVGEKQWCMVVYCA